MGPSVCLFRVDGLQDPCVETRQARGMKVGIEGRNECASWKNEFIARRE